MSGRVFFITGTSTGFGQELTKIVVANGDKVAATARNSSKLEAPEGATKENYFPVDLDVTKKDSIQNAFDSAFEHFGRIDVVVNNAGYGLSGEFESLSEKQIRTQVSSITRQFALSIYSPPLEEWRDGKHTDTDDLQMEINFFGLIDCTRKAMQIMREKNSPSGGLIQQVTSIGGQRGVPMFSIYCASKWAVEGFTEAINQEVKPEWGIKFTCIEPGGFRTDWAGRSMDFGEEKCEAYDHIDAKRAMGERNGTQAGDPHKGAKAFYGECFWPYLSGCCGSWRSLTMINRTRHHERSSSSLRRRYRRLCCNQWKA